MDKTRIYMYLHIALIKSSAGNETRFFPSPFLFSTSWFLILADALQNDHILACSTVLRSAIEKKEIGGYVNVPCSSKMTKRKSTADCIKFK